MGCRIHTSSRNCLAVPFPFSPFHHFTKFIYIYTLYFFHIFFLYCAWFVWRKTGTLSHYFSSFGMHSMLHMVDLLHCHWAKCCFNISFLFLSFFCYVIRIRIRIEFTKFLGSISSIHLNFGTFLASSSVQSGSYYKLFFVVYI